MFTIASSLEVYVCTSPIDMRKSFYSLSAVVETVMNKNPLSGHLFVFLNKRKNMVKVLFWDRSGYCIFYKRLESGTFTMQKDVKSGIYKESIAVPELSLMLEGIDLSSAKRKKRYKLKTL